jgi:hypothetical protein
MASTPAVDQRAAAPALLPAATKRASRGRQGDTRAHIGWRPCRVRKSSSGKRQAKRSSQAAWFSTRCVPRSFSTSVLLEAPRRAACVMMASAAAVDGELGPVQQVAGAAGFARLWLALRAVSLNFAFQSKITCLDWSPDSRRVATGGCRLQRLPPTPPSTASLQRLPPPPPPSPLTCRPCQLVFNIFPTVICCATFPVVSKHMPGASQSITLYFC